MKRKSRHSYLHTVSCLLILSSSSLAIADGAQNEATLTPANVIDSSIASDWRQPKQDNLLHLQTETGEVIFELAPQYAPKHIDNLRLLISERFFDGLAIVRSHDNYVVQWGDPNAGTDSAKNQGKALAKLEPEFFRTSQDSAMVAIDSRDAYADKVGFVNGFSVASDNDNTWLTHCYGALGVGRGMAANSGNSAELYVVTGHSPRHLDKNVTLIGRVLVGIELLSSLPRGTGPLGFYATPEERTTIKAIRFGNELPQAQQSKLEIMRTDTDTFRNYVTSRTIRLNKWFLDKTGKIEVCNVGVPIREAS